MVTYRSLQEQVNDILTFGVSVICIGIIFGMLKSLVREMLAEEAPVLLPQTKQERSDSMQGYGVWDSFLDPSAAYAEARKLRQQGWPVRVTERGIAGGKKYIVWIGRKETPPEIFPQIVEEIGMVPPQYRYLVSWISEPLPAYSLATVELLPKTLPSDVSETKGRQIDEVLKQLKDGVEGIQGSHNFRQFLLTMSKFHNYSIGNLILIAIQKPDATRVAGFNT